MKTDIWLMRSLVLSMIIAIVTGCRDKPLPDDGLKLQETATIDSRDDVEVTVDGVDKVSIRCQIRCQSTRVL